MGRLFKIFPNLSQNCLKFKKILKKIGWFCPKFGTNLSRLVYEWVTFSWKIGTCMGVLSNYMAAHPYHNQTWVPPGTLSTKYFKTIGVTRGGFCELKIQTCRRILASNFSNISIQCGYFWVVKYQFLRILPPKSNKIEFGEFFVQTLCNGPGPYDPGALFRGNKSKISREGSIGQDGQAFSDRARCGSLYNFSFFVYLGWSMGGTHILFFLQP